MKNTTWRVTTPTIKHGLCCDFTGRPVTMIDCSIEGQLEGPIRYNDIESLELSISSALNGYDDTPKPKVEKVIFNNPATIILWTDGTKTVVKCQPGDTYSKEVGFITAYLKKLLGNDNTFNKEITKWVPDEIIHPLKTSLFCSVKCELPEEVAKAIKRKFGMVSPNLPRNIDEMHSVPNTTCELCEDGDEELMKKTIRRTRSTIIRRRFQYCPACGRKLIKPEK